MQPHSFKLSRTRLILLIVGAVILLILGWHYWNGEGDKSSNSSDGSSSHQAGAKHPIPVEITSATRTDTPVYLEGLGTVQAFYTVTVTARVDGQLQKVGFIEGQTVHRGDFLAQIDPRPSQAALELANATKLKDEAQLENAKRDLQRYTALAPDNLVSKQTLDTQNALVAQLEAQVQGDQAAIDNAQTQLEYTTITSPIEGRTGIRLVDPGNNVHASDTTGIVVVTQIHPISVIFTLPEDDFLTISQALAAGPVSVTALSRDGKTELDRGTVAMIDNQIDQTTGTIRLKATFPNTHNTLWPGAFVNIRALEKTEHDTLTVPSVAIERGPNGTFVYVVKKDSTIDARPVVIGESNDTSTVVKSGITQEDRIVISNQYQLQPSSLVQVNSDNSSKSSSVNSQ